MEPITIAIFVFTIVVAVVCTFVFKWATTETSFEEAYGNSARKLLTDGKTSKVKPKPKPKKGGKGDGLKEENRSFETLTSQPAQKETCIQQLSNDLETLPSELPKKTADEDEVNSLKAAIEKIKSENAELSQANRVISASKTAAEKKLAELQKSRVDVDRALKRTTDEVALYKKEALKYKANLAAQQEKCEAQQIEVTKHKSDLEAQQNKYEMLESSVRNKLVEAVQLKEENRRFAMLASQTAQKDARIQQLSYDLETLRAELAKKTADGDEVNALKGAIEKIKVEYAELSQAYRDVIGSKTAVENQLAELQKGHVDVDRALKHMTDEVAFYQQEALKYKANLAAQQEKCEVQQMEVSKHKSDLEAQQNKYEMLESSLRSKLAEAVQLNEENRRLSMLTSQTAQKDTHIQQLSYDLEALRAELAKKTADGDEVNTLTAAIEKIKVEYAELSQAYRDVSASKTAVEKQLVELQNGHVDVDRAQTENNNLEAQNNELKKQIEQYSRALTTLKNHLVNVERAAEEII